MGETALAKVKVLEYCHSIAGAHCGKLLSGFGAEVIKVEKPLLGDDARRRGPYPNDIPHPEKSGLFLYLNINKLGVTLDLAINTGRRIFSELASDSDILIEDNPPGIMEDMGLGYETLREHNSSIIVTSITPFGQTGPYANHKAFGLNVNSAGGQGYVTPAGFGFPDRPPLKKGKYVDEYNMGIGAAIATLGALYGRRMNGRGVHVDMSMQEWGLSTFKWEWARYTGAGVISSRKTSGRSVYGILRCKDGYFILLTAEEHQWVRLTELVGRVDWLTDERFCDAFARQEHGEELNQLISEWASNYTKEEIYHKAQAMGIPIAPFNTLHDCYASRQLMERKFFVDIAHQEAGKFRYPWVPYRLSETSCMVESAAPTLGQHNEEIYCKRLGHSKEELVKLGQARVI